MSATHLNGRAEAQRILVVEDDMVNRLLLQRNLESAGYEVMVATNGVEALQMAEDFSPSLILMDAMMPKMDGFGAIRILRERPETANLPILMLTSLEETDSKVRGLDCGANDYLVKPVDTKELLARVRAALRTEAGRLHAVELAETDALLGDMGVYSRRYFDRLLVNEYARAARNRQMMGLLMIDIDHFKKVNDSHGHETGDRVLIALAGRSVSGGRSYERLCRYGGEEFTMILPHTDNQHAGMAGERIRSLVDESPFRIGPLALDITVSVGAASISPELGGNPLRLVRLADKRLYAAKNAGRNCTVNYDGVENAEINLQAT